MKINYLLLSLNTVRNKHVSDKPLKHINLLLQMNFLDRISHRYLKQHAPQQRSPVHWFNAGLFRSESLLTLEGNVRSWLSL